MDPVTVIATALVAGAAAGSGDAASMAVRDAYTALRDRIRRIAPGSETETVIEANEAVPGSNIAEVRDVLARAQVIDVEQLQAMAAALLSHLPADRVTQARARIDVRDAQGIQIGDHNTQHNTFR